MKGRKSVGYILVIELMEMGYSYGKQGRESIGTPKYDTHFLQYIAFSFVWDSSISEVFGVMY